MEELAQANDWEFTIPDYKGKGYNLYYNFNTAFSNSFSQSEQYLIDPDMEPPQGFEWFFQTGGDWEKYSRRGVIEAHYTINPDGSKNMISQIHRDRFDPTDFYTGNTWFAYTDENGKRHVFSADVFFTDNESDLMNVGSLFNPPDAEKWDVVRSFLKNLQLYPKGYFSRIVNPFSFNCLT